MTRNQNHDASTSSRKKMFKTCDNGGVGRWSDLSHDMLFLVTMQLGIIDFLSFSGVCKSWRSFALSNWKRFMVSRSPMSIHMSSMSSHGYCCLEDFEGRKLKAIIPHSPERTCVGLTCGYLVLYGEETNDFWLVNPITRHQLHFPAFPCVPSLYLFKAILVFSSSLNDWVFVVSHNSSHNLWFSMSGKGIWNHVFSTLPVIDLHAFNGKIYILHNNYRVCEMRLNSEPGLTLLEIKNSPKLCVSYPVFVSSGENLYVMDQSSQDLSRIQELDFEKMEWVLPEKKTIGEYAFFLNTWKGGAAIIPESWGLAAEPPSKYKRHSYECFLDTTPTGRVFGANMWYFPHLCLDVDPVN